MGLPQGIDFRATSGFVTDPANCTFEIGTTANYPRVTPQGVTVGWENSVDGTRDRVSGNDARLAGTAFSTNANPVKAYRIDLPSTGTYSVNLAAGDASYSQPACKVEFFDNTTSLGIACNGATGAANKFFDAIGNLWTNVAWPGSNVAASLTFASTIFRAKVGGGASASSSIVHLFVASSGGAAGGFGALLSDRRSLIVGGGLVI